MTKAQRAALKLAVKNGGELVEGGVDKDPVRRDVILRLYDMGYLRCAPPSDFYSQPWTITEAGRKAIEK